MSPNGISAKKDDKIEKVPNEILDVLAAKEGALGLDVTGENALFHV